jgi:hypothetical protein
VQPQNLIDLKHDIPFVSQLPFLQPPEEATIDGYKRRAFLHPVTDRDGHFLGHQVVGISEGEAKPGSTGFCSAETT